MELLLIEEHPQLSNVPEYCVVLDESGVAQLAQHVLHRVELRGLDGPVVRHVR